MGWIQVESDASSSATAGDWFTWAILPPVVARNPAESITPARTIVRSA
ncbi:MAG: hypothetical protein IPG75_20545 [Gemmatimonadetes bacterium]|nr:hypothetical protein [Gemmatimonadota bacterium]